jgi:pilus assembly protein CpaB
MDVKKIMLIIGAMIVALGAAFGVNQMMRGSASPSAKAAATGQIDGPKVLVATRALPVGTILTADALRFQPWPQDLVKPDQYYTEGRADLSALAGSVVRVAVTAGAPVTKGALVDPQDRGFLAAALGAGMRAVTVPLSADQGVAGFVFPGDRVDLLLTLTLEDEENNNAKLYTTETIVRNLRVLAVDQRSTPTDENGASTPALYATVTLEATPRIAESIAVARTTGTVSLALRSIADTQGELEEAIASGALSVPRDGDRRGEARMLGGQGGRPTMDRGAATTGGDVSRYLRRGMSPRNARPPQASNSGGGNSDNSGGGSAPTAPTGPTVRVVRGDQVTIVPVGGK